MPTVDLVPLNVRIPKALDRRIAELAAARSMSKASVVKLAIVEHLERTSGANVPSATAAAVHDEGRRAITGELVETVQAIETAANGVQQMVGALAKLSALAKGK